jgi:hypothetical protein
MNEIATDVMKVNSLTATTGVRAGVQAGGRRVRIGQAVSFSGLSFPSFYSCY